LKDNSDPDFGGRFRGASGDELRAGFPRDFDEWFDADLADGFDLGLDDLVDEIGDGGGGKSDVDESGDASDGDFEDGFDEDFVDGFGG
jgi:hypothetical protein